MVGVPRPFWETRKNHVKIWGVGVGAVWASKVTQIGVPGDPRGCKNHKNLIFWWTPVCRNMIMLGSETVLYGVKQHSGVARRRRLVPGSPGLALGAFSGPPLARLVMLHLARLNGSQGRLGWLAPGLGNARQSIDSSTCTLQLGFAL